MKKAVSALLCLLMLTGCTRFNVNISVPTPEAAASLGAQSAPEASEAPDVEVPADTSAPAREALPADAYFSATAADAFTGPLEFVAEEAGSYRFVAAQSDEDVSWEIYVLDEEFEDALRYLPQSKDPAATLEGDGEAELDLKSDQFVYCFCSQSRLTLDEPTAAGDLSVYFTPASHEAAPVRAQAADSVDVDAADIWADGGYSFQAEQDAVYTLTRDGDADWDVYVLDEEFEDALRYLPQAYEPAASNEGTVSVKMGQMVYVLCGENPFTADEAPESGVDVLHLTAE